MAISVNDGFSLKGGVALDDRQVLTKQEMLDIADYDLPDVYFAVCKDNGKLYVFDKTNDIDTETGKFRMIDGDELELYKKEDIEALIGLTEEEINNLQSLLNDENISVDHVWSSSKIYTEIANTLSEAKKYTLEEIEKIHKGGHKIVDSMDEMTDDSLIYLIFNEDKYDAYVLNEDGTPINIIDYYSKEKIDEDFLKKQQGVENSGKSLVIGEDGKVSIGDVADTSWTGTLEEFEALDKDLLKDGQQINILDDYGGTSRNEIDYYTEEEKVIGKFINKPLYRKTIVGDGNFNTVVFASNVDTLVKSYGSVYYPSENNWYMLPWVSSSTTASLILKPTKEVVGNSVGLFSKWKVTIEYTKIDD